MQTLTACLTASNLIARDTACGELLTLGGSIPLTALAVLTAAVLATATNRFI